MPLVFASDGFACARNSVRYRGSALIAGAPARSRELGNLRIGRGGIAPGRGLRPGFVRLARPQHVSHEEEITIRSPATPQTESNTRRFVSPGAGLQSIGNKIACLGYRGKCAHCQALAKEPGRSSAACHHSPSQFMIMMANYGHTVYRSREAGMRLLSDVHRIDRARHVLRRAALRATRGGPR